MLSRLWKMPTPTADSERLRALASKHARSLVEHGALAVAATGSVGRGDAGASSDLDLWVIDEREGVDYDVVDDVPITHMREAPARVMTVAHLSNIEVEPTLVLVDERGIFRDVLALYEKNAAAILAANLAGARARVDALVEASHDGTPAGRLWALREAAHIACAARVYEDAGLMMPKMRHFRELLAPAAFAALVDVQGYRDVPIDDVVWATERIADRMNAQLAQIIERPLPVTTPDNALLKLTSGDVDDGVLLLRSFFKKSFIEPLQAAIPGLSTVQFLDEDADPAIRAYWEAIHGAADDDKVARARASFTTLTAQLTARER